MYTTPKTDANTTQNHLLRNFLANGSGCRYNSKSRIRSVNVGVFRVFGMCLIVSFAEVLPNSMDQKGSQ